MAENRINIVIQADNKASKPIKDVSSSLDDVANRSDAAGKRTGAFGNIGAAAFGAVKIAAVAAGASFVAASGFAISSAADYEQSLNVFQSVSSATAEQMTVVSARARQLGQDVALPGISAKDAAFAMVELSKAGLSVNDTLGASKGVLALAKAGNLETAEAASIAANALNAFNLKGSEATRVADLLAAGANASSADVRDMAYSLQMSSAMAASVKVPVEDLTTAIAEMANNGIAGSDAGTSLKSMFMNLIPTTDRAKSSMRALNLDFYDAKGNFVGLRDMVAQLQRGTKGLTDEQRALHIENIFGADSSRAVNVLLKEGVEGYDKLRGAVTKQGAATDLAKAQNSGFKGVLDNLKSSLETVAIDVGSKVLPKLGELIELIGPTLITAVQNSGQVLGPVIDGIVGVVRGLARAWDAVKDAYARVLEQMRPGIDWFKQYAIPILAEISRIIRDEFIKSWDGIAQAVKDTDKVLEDAGLKINTLGLILIGLSIPVGILIGSLVGVITVVIAVILMFAKIIEFGARLHSFFVNLATQVGRNMGRFKEEVARNVIAVVGFFMELPNRIAGHILRLWGAAVGAFNRFKANAKAWARDTVADIVGQFTSLPGRIGNIVSSSITKANNDVKGGIGSIGKQLKLPGFASGTPYATGGLTLVGERGPELVNLPRGSRVTQAWETRSSGSQGAGDSGTTIHVHGDVVLQDQSAVAAWFKNADQAQRFARMGMAA